MPQALEPGILHRLVLDCDTDKNPTPAFHLRARSLREQMQLGDALDSLQGSDNSRDLYTHAHGVLAKLIVGWENIARDGADIPFSSDALWDVLTVPETWELIRKALAAGRVDADEKKESELPH